MREIQFIMLQFFLIEFLKWSSFPEPPPWQLCKQMIEKSLAVRMTTSQSQVEFIYFTFFVLSLLMFTNANSWMLWWPWNNYFTIVGHWPSLCSISWVRGLNEDKHQTLKLAIANFFFIELTFSKFHCSMSSGYFRTCFEILEDKLLSCDQFYF